MALLTDQEVQLRISARADGGAGVDALTTSVDDLQKELDAVGESAKKSGAAQAEAAAKLAVAKARTDEVKLSLISAKNEYKFLAERAKESGAAQSIFADQAARAKDRIAALNSDLIVARGTVKLAADAHRNAARETKGHANEQQRLADQLREVEAEARRAGSATDSLASAAKNAAKGLVGIEMGRQFIEANVGLESLERSLTQILGSSQKAATEIEWLRNTTNRMGIDTLSAGRAYTSLAASAKGTSLEGEGTRRIFEAVAGSMAKLGKSSADTEGALQAVSQMMGKGVVSMEEMRQQLAERLPGAMQATADASGVTVGELTEMIASGNVLAEDLLPKLAQGLEKMYGTGGQAEGTVSAWNRLKNAVAETFQFVGQSGVMTALAAILMGVASAVRFLTASFDLLGRQIGITLGAIVSFDFSSPIQSLKNWKAALQEAADETYGTMNKAAASIDGAAAAQNKLSAQTAHASDAAQASAASWLTVVNAYSRVGDAAKTATEQSVKSAAARQEEGKAILGLANLLGTETEKRAAALQVAEQDAQALQTLANARQHEAAVAKAQAESLAVVAAAEGAVSEQKRKAIQEANDKAAALQAEADKSAAAALGANQHAAALQTETAALADNASRLGELKSAAEQAASALEVVRINREFGAASAQQASDAEIRAAQAAALYRDALHDQTAAIQRNASEKQSQIAIEQAGIRLAIEQQRTIYQVARARGDEYGATQALIEIKRLEIKLAELVAQAKRAEADAALLTVKAKRAELEASGQLTPAKVAELKAAEASAQVKKVEAEISAELAKRSRELSNEVDAAGGAASRAAGGYDQLADSLGNVAGAADRAKAGLDGVNSTSNSTSFNDGGRQADKAVDVASMLYQQGASVAEAEAATKYYSELYKRNAATMLTGNLGNGGNAAMMTNRANKMALNEALRLARQELETGQAVDLGASVDELIKRNTAQMPKSLTPAGGQAAQIAAVKNAGNEAKAQKTIRLELSSGGKTSVLHAEDEASANAFIKTLELAGMRAAR